MEHMIMQITKHNGKWRMGDKEFKSSDEALAYLESEGTRIESEKARGAVVSLTSRGQIRISGTDREVFGAYPITLTGAQFDILAAVWPDVIAAAAEARKAGKLVNRWQDLPAAEPKGASIRRS